MAGAEDGSLVVLNRDLNTLNRVKVSDAPLLSLALDGQARRIYVVLPLTPGRHGIAVLDQDTLQPLDLLGGDYEHPLTGLYKVHVAPLSGLLVGCDREQWIFIDPVQRLLTSRPFAAEDDSIRSTCVKPKGERIYYLQ